MRGMPLSRGESTYGTWPAAATRRSGGRQALIAAAAWKGEVVVRVRGTDGWAVLEITDNGIGMTEEVRQRCTETHFSTKRNNALFEGMTAGMGLGLSFVQVILDHHGAKIEVESQPLQGATFRVRFPLKPPPVAARMRCRKRKDLSAFRACRLRQRSVKRC